MKRREVLDRLPDKERLLVASAWDKAERAGRNWNVEYTHFLDPGERLVLEEHSYLWDIGIASFGGYDGAEREVLAFYPGGEEPAFADYPLKAVQVNGNFQFASVTHRDYMGSLLSLGLKRELFGDIIVLPEGCQVLLHTSALNWILANWQSVGRVTVQVGEIPMVEVQVPERDMLVRISTVSTLRLDAVAAAAYCISRSKAADLIRAGKMKLNYRPEQRVDRVVEQGAMLSLSGYGRAELQEVGGASRSGRLHIKIARWQ